MNTRLFTLTLLSLAACGDIHTQSDSGTSPACFNNQTLWISTNGVDRASGTLAAFDPATQSVCARVVMLTGDSLLAWHDRTLVALNYATQNDNVARYGVTSWPPALESEVPMSDRGTETGGGNARGYLALDANRAYVARWNQRSLAVLDRSGTNCREAICARIDLQAFAGTAPMPNPYDMAWVDQRVWLSLQRLPGDLTRFDQAGLLLVLDPSRNEVVDVDAAMPGTQGIALRYPNPTSRLTVWNGHVVVATTGSYRVVGDGALEWIDTQHPERGSEVLLDEQAMQGNLDAVLALDADRLLLRISDQANGALEIMHTKLVVFSLRTRALESQPWVSVSDWTLTEPILARDGRVYVGDRGGLMRASGLRVFDAMTGRELTRQPIAVGQEPYQLLETK